MSGAAPVSGWWRRRAVRAPVRRLRALPAALAAGWLLAGAAGPAEAYRYYPPEAIMAADAVRWWPDELVLAAVAPGCDPVVLTCAAAGCDR